MSVIRLLPGHFQGRGAGWFTWQAATCAAGQLWLWEKPTKRLDQCPSGDEFNKLASKWVKSCLFYNLNPSVLGAPLEPGNAEAPRIRGAVIRPLGPLLPGADLGPPSPSLGQQTLFPRPQRSQECTPTEGWPAERPKSGMSPTSVLGAGGDKGLSGRRISPAAVQAASLPATWLAGPRDPRGVR